MLCKGGAWICGVYAFGIAIKTNNNKFAGINNRLWRLWFTKDGIQPLYAYMHESLWLVSTEKKNKIMPTTKLTE